MARYNEILTGRYNRLLQKLLQMKGGPPAPQLASEISPQLSIPDLGVESRFHLGWNSFGFAINTAAGVGTASAAQLRNPPNSKVIGVIHKIQVESSVAQEVDIANLAGALLIDLTSIAGVTSMDQRFVAPPGGSMIIGSSTANATGGNIFERVQLQAGVPYQVIVYENQEIVLPPSSLVRVTESSLNQGLMVTFQWRERVLEDSELT